MKRSSIILSYVTEGLSSAVRKFWCYARRYLTIRINYSIGASASPAALAVNRNEAQASELSAFKSFGDHPELLENLPDIPQDLEWVKMGKRIESYK